ncbi:MAG: S1 family peptidase [Pseudomonadota bacterium]
MRVPSTAAWLAFALLARVEGTAADVLRGDQVRIAPADGFARVLAVDAAGATVGHGSAVAVAPGRLLTACHVVAGAAQVVIVREDGYRLASPERAAPALDLCLLSVGRDTTLTPLTRRAGGVGADPLVAGAPVTLVGFGPDGGVIVSRGRFAGGGVVAGSALLLADAALPAGMSGGGLFDGDGRLIGLAIGRDPVSGQALAVDLRRLEAVALARARAWPPASARAPAFLDVGRVWPDLALLHLSLAARGTADRSLANGEWIFARAGATCEVHARRSGPGAPALKLRLAAGPDGPSVTLDVVADGIPAWRAMASLEVALLPGGASFALPPVALRRAGEDTTADVWQVEWRLADAVALLRALPASQGLIASHAGSDLLAIETDAFELWRNLREVCF